MNNLLLDVIQTCTKYRNVLKYDCCIGCPFNIEYDHYFECYFKDDPTEWVYSDIEDIINNTKEVNDHA